MAKHCQECHQLTFEPALTSRQVPHGAIANAEQTVREFYADLALNATADSFSKAFGVEGAGLLRRVGRTETDRPQVLALARAKAEKVTRELIEVRACMTCHNITRNEVEVDGTKRVDWQMAPIRTHHVWMPKARFNHQSHAVANCAECHASAQSGKAEDVSMPTIADCRKCHGGERIVMGKVSSNCMMCHGFHVDGQTWPSHMPSSVNVAVTPAVAGEALQPSSGAKGKLE
jgi:hypothetical protein